MLVACSAFLCRTRTERRRDPRLVGEFALVVLTMLFVSERSWKHHYVTFSCRITYLMCEFALARGVTLRDRVLVSAAIWARSC